MKTLKKHLYDIVLAAVLILAATMIFNGYHVILTDGCSMNPAINSGETLIEKDNNFKVDRFDIVNIELNDTQAISTEGNKSVNKRIVGMPGETVEIKNDVVYINGMQLNEPFERLESGHSLAGRNMKPIVLESDEYFIMGDNRDDSTDSRTFGPVNANQIKAVILLPEQENWFEKGLHAVWNILH
jgi:signal peptidase I